MSDYWDEMFYLDTLQFILREYHPVNSAFYRISMTDNTETEDGWSVSFFWMVKADLVSSRNCGRY